MKEIKLNAEKVWYKWEQVNFGDFIQICEAQRDKNEIRILGLATGVDEHVLRKAKIGPDFEVVMTRLRFLYKPPIWNDNPTKLGEYTMPKDITFESVEQFESMRQQYANPVKVDAEDPIEEMRRFGVLCAIYLQPIIDKADFDPDKAWALMPEINKFSCVEVVSIGRFFWAKLVSLRSGIPMTSLMQSTPRRNWRRDLISFLRRSISTLRSKFSRKATYSSSGLS